MLPCLFINGMCVPFRFCRGKSAIEHYHQKARSLKHDADLISVSIM